VVANHDKLDIMHDKYVSYGILQVASSDGTNTLIITIIVNALSCILSIGFSQSPAPL
jgi:hypothetical protein